jgi:heat shock protein HslJ
MNTRGLGSSIALSAALIALMVGGCADSDNGSNGGGSGPGPSMGDLAGRAFVSTSVTEGDEPYDLVTGTHINLAFSDTGISATAGCNHLSGDATYAGSVLVIDGAGLAMTEMGCEPALMDQDTWLADILDSEPTVRLDGDRLTVTSGDIVIAFLDQDTVEPDQPLVGTMWTLDAMGTTGDDGAVSSIPDDVESTLQIDERGTASLRPGCNTGRASVEITDTTVTFGPVALTRMACQGAPGDVEAAVLTVIDGEVDYAIDGTQLALTNGDHTLTYRMADEVDQAE